MRTTIDDHVISSALRHLRTCTHVSQDLRLVGVIDNAIDQLSQLEHERKALRAADDQGPANQPAFSPNGVAA